MEQNLQEIWDFLIEHNLCSEQTLQVATDVGGFTEETMNTIIYSLTGYNTFEQLKEEY
jgi:hypothetical protein